METALLERIEKRHQDARPGAADGVSQSDGAPVDVDTAPVPALLLQLAAVGEGLGSKGLVDLEEVVVGERRARALEHAADGMHRGDEEPFGRHAGLAVADDACQGPDAQLAGFFAAHHHQRGSAVGDAGRVAGGHDAIGLERRAELGEGFRRRITPRALVHVKENGRLLALRYLDGGDFVPKASGIDGIHGLALAVMGKLVQLGAREAVLLGNELGRHAHVPIGEGTP